MIFRIYYLSRQPEQYYMKMSAFATELSGLDASWGPNIFVADFTSSLDFGSVSLYLTSY